MRELEDELAEAEKRIAKGAEAIRKQQAIIARLQRRGKDISAARKLLGELHAAQLKLAIEQDRVRKALAKVIGSSA
jgi:hypothetical protein